MTETLRSRVVHRIVKTMPLWQFPERSEKLITYWLHHERSVLLVRNDDHAKVAVVFDDPLPFQFLFDAYGSDT